MPPPNSPASELGWTAGAQSGSKRTSPLDCNPRATERFLGRITRISLLLPAGFVALICLILLLVKSGWVQAQYQVNTLTEIATRDIAVRNAASALNNATNDINTRLVSVLGTVQSSSGSASIVAQLFAELRSNWSNLNSHLSGAEAQQLQALAQRYAKLTALERKSVEALRGGYLEQVAQVYDEWLDQAGPFRADLQGLVARLDDDGAKKIATTLDVANQNALLSIFLGAVGGLIGLIAGCYVVLGVVRPLAGIERAIADLSRGHYQTAIQPTRRRDEIGKIIGALSSFQSSLAENHVLRANQVRQAERAELERRELLVKFTGDLQTNVCAVAQAVGSAAIKIEESIVAAHDLVGRTEDQAQIAADGAAKATQNVQSVAGASKQLAASIAEISTHVSQSTEVVKRAANQAAQANLMMSDLRAAMAQIEQVIDLIRAVAGQTHLLALNATIEAARAGEAGRGFSIVASEVKQLAFQTAKATDEIALQITAVQKAEQNVLDAIGGIGSTVDEINEIAREIVGAVEEQESATVEIARSIEEVAVGAGQISGSINKVSGAATESGKQADELKAAAGELNRHSATLRHEIERFVQVVQAA